MQTFLIILIVLVVAIAGYIVVTYNALVRFRQMVNEAWSGIDIQLKRRADLIPTISRPVGLNLTEAVEYSVDPKVGRRGAKDRPNRCGGEHRDHRLGNIRHPCSDPVPRDHSAGSKPVCDAGDLSTHLGATQRPCRTRTFIACDVHEIIRL